MLNDQLEEARIQNGRLQQEVTMLRRRERESTGEGKGGEPGDGTDTPLKKRFNVPEIEIPATETPNERTRASLRTPVSHGGRKLNARLVKDLDLPEEAWAEDMAAMQAQLVECLEELLAKQELVKSLKSDLLKYERDMEVMCDQTALLYAEYAEERNGKY